ncbi:ABC-2 type transporter family protein [Striga asiatica]|uniref:ABC-2 type transporter family protein n=1 Tax=Striga asiatica TaxID=4170 RepID=A0A5A7QWN8_STRAF|nr:ABC-2 type transporter family protein [Striga asiatica]
MSAGSGSVGRARPASTSTWLPENSTLAPTEANMEAMALMSDTLGTLLSLDGPVQQSVAASMERAEFLDPLMWTWPDSLDPPAITSFGPCSGQWVWVSGNELTLGAICDVYLDQRQIRRRLPGAALRRRLLESPAPKEEKPDAVAGDGGHEHPGVERHDGEHHEVDQPDPDDVHRRLGSGGGRRRPSPEDPAVGQPLCGGRKEEDHRQGQRVHPRMAVARPPIEQDFRVLAPEERHVHHHVAAAHRRGRWCCRRHAVYMATVVHLFLLER